MYINIGYYVAKALSYGLTLSEVETMSFIKLSAIMNATKAVEAERNIDLLHIVANPKLLDGKKSAKNYSKLFKTYEKTFKQCGIKEVTTRADMSILEMLKAQQKGAR